MARRPRSEGRWGSGLGQQLWQKRLEDIGEICEEREREEVAFNTGAEQKLHAAQNGGFVLSDMIMS